MSSPAQNYCRNYLLRALSNDAYALLQPHLRSMPLKSSDRLIEANAPISTIQFVESGIVSLVAQASDGTQIEIGLVGREGLIGIPLLLGTDRTPHEGRVQVPGSAYALSADAFHKVGRDALGLGFDLPNVLLRYVQILGVQLAYTALANARYKIEHRLARWLLMCHDRLDGDVLPTTHLFLSLMLGINRPGLTAAVASFERAGLIQTRRGSIAIRERDKLLELAGAAYGPAEAEYTRLIGPSASKP
jgi:CRP-like cAMP-binding protein